MPERLTPLEASLLALDTARNPSSVGTLVICTEDPDAFVDERVLALIAERIAYVPRYRQRVSQPVGGLAGAFWVDDDGFDLDYHVQRLTLAAPGGMSELHELVAELLGRRLDHARPLWEAYVIEGLEGGRFALVTKTHPSLVNGLDTVDLAQVLLDDEPVSTAIQPGTWRPDPSPSPAELLAKSLVRGVQDPGYVVDSVRVAVTGTLGAAVALGQGAGGLSEAVGELAEEALRGGPRSDHSPLIGRPTAPQLATAVVELAALRSVSARQQVSVHDVILAVLTGALRGWLLDRGASLSSGRVLTALVPMAVAEDEAGLSALGCQLTPQLQRLPVGEPNAMVRLQLLGHGTRAFRAGHRPVAARWLSEIAGFAPATLHILALRAAVDRWRRDVVVGNAPGPQQARFLAGSEVVACYPVASPAAALPLSIGVTSYRGQVFFSLSGGPGGSDLDVLVRCLHLAVGELRDIRTGAGRGRKP